MAELPPIAMAGEIPTEHPEQTLEELWAALDNGQLWDVEIADVKALLRGLLDEALSEGELCNQEHFERKPCDMYCPDCAERCNRCSKRALRARIDAL